MLSCHYGPKSLKHSSSTFFQLPAHLKDESSSEGKKAPNKVLSECMLSDMSVPLFLALWDEGSIANPFSMTPGNVCEVSSVWFP